MINMALTSANVRVAVTGALHVGPVGTTAPTDGSSALTGMSDLGYFSDDGVTETRDRSTNEIRAWQKADLVREVVTEASLSFGGTMIETKLETVELYYGEAVDTVSGKIVIVPANTGGRQAFVLDVIDGDDFIRCWVPSGEIIEVGEIVYASGEAIGYPITLKAYPDPSITAADGSPGSAVKWYSSLVAGV